MKPFRFKYFEIQQSKEVFRVGTDGVLLGALAEINLAKNVLEIGTGTGIISLMLAQRFPQATFHGIDINTEAAKLTRLNFQNSPFAERLQNECVDLKVFNSVVEFDAVVSNPPYFEVSDSNKDKIARQVVELNFAQLISKVSEILVLDGVFSVIIPEESGEFFIQLANRRGFFLNRRVNIKGIGNSKVKRLLLEFSFVEKSVLDIDFTIEKSPRQYSDQYLEVTKDFHVFKKD